MVKNKQDSEKYNSRAYTSLGSCFCIMFGIFCCITLGLVLQSWFASFMRHCLIVFVSCLIVVGSLLHRFGIVLGSSLDHFGTVCGDVGKVEGYMF